MGKKDRLVEAKRESRTSRAKDINNARGGYGAVLHVEIIDELINHSHSFYTTALLNEIRLPPSLHVMKPCEFPTYSCPALQLLRNKEHGELGDLIPSQKIIPKRGHYTSNKTPVSLFPSKLEFELPNKPFPKKST